MKDKSSKLITGCGIGCGVFVLIIIISGVMLFTFIKNVGEDIDKIEVVENAMEEKFGKVEQYVPEFPISEKRLNTFLSIRDSLNLQAKELVEEIDNISDEIEDDEKEKSFWETIGIIKSGLNIIPAVVEYYSTRSQLFLSNDMSPGEYYNIYSTVYFVWLNRSPGDGPPFPIDEENSVGAEITFDKKKNLDKENSAKLKHDRETVMLRDINYLFVRQYENYLKENSTIKENNMLVKLIESEVEQLYSNPYSLPWKQDLPQEFVEIFEKNRFLIETSYNEQLNSIELKQLFD